MWFEIFGAINTFCVTALLLWIKYDQVRAYNSLTRHQKIIYDKLVQFEAVESETKGEYEGDVSDILGETPKENTEQPSNTVSPDPATYVDNSSPQEDPLLTSILNTPAPSNCIDNFDDLDLDDDDDALSPEEEIDILNNLRHLEGESFGNVEKHVHAIHYRLRDANLEGPLKKYNPKVISVQVDNGLVTKFLGIGGK